jgi:hypothetical protein
VLDEHQPVTLLYEKKGKSRKKGEARPPQRSCLNFLGVRETFVGSSHKPIPPSKK